MHNIEFTSFGENCDRQDVVDQISRYCEHEGDGLYNGIRWLENAGILKDREAAQDYLEKRDRGSYDNLAVRYYYRMEVDTPKAKELDMKVAEARKEWLRRNDVLYPKTLTAEFIGCKNCGSKLKREFLHMNKCPVCGKDLRPASMMKPILSARQKWEHASAAAIRYREAHGEQKICWLVKYEYHS